MKRTHRLLAAALLFAILSLPALHAVADATEIFRDSSLRRVVYMPDGSGPFQYYAQNDPVWNGLVYETSASRSYRVFGEGGCNPTALAMVVASLVPAEHLNRVGMIPAQGRTFTLCTCSVNGFYCHMSRRDPSHTPSILVTNADFAAALPLAFADFATGNNPARHEHRLLGASQGGNGGTSKTLFDPIAEIYGLSLRTSREMSDALETLDRGGMVIVLASGNSQIFSGSNGHYLVICSYDEDYLYMMDPFVRDRYPKDRRGLIERMGDGILRVRRTNGGQLGFGTYALFEAPNPTYFASLPVLQNPYTLEVAVTASASGGLTAMGGR